MTGLEIAEERERDASRQRRRGARSCRYCSSRGKARGKERRGRRSRDVGSQLACVFAPADVETDELSSLKLLQT